MAVILPGSVRSGRRMICSWVLHGHGSIGGSISQRAGRMPGGEGHGGRAGMILVSPGLQGETSWMGPKAEADVLQILDKLKADYRIGKTVLAEARWGLPFDVDVCRQRTRAACRRPGGDERHGQPPGAWRTSRRRFASRSAAARRKSPWNTQKNRMLNTCRAAQLDADRSTTEAKTNRAPDSVVRLAAVPKSLQPNVLLIHWPEGGYSTDYEDLQGGAGIRPHTAEVEKATVPCRGRVHSG